MGILETTTSIIDIGSKIARPFVNAGMTKRQYERQKELIRMQNAYNTPKNQARLYAAAGFNPALAMTNGGFEPSAGGNAPAPIPMDAMDTSTSLMQMQQSRLLEASIEKTNEEMLKTRAERLGITMDNEIKEKTKEASIQLIQANLTGTLTNNQLQDAFLDNTKKEGVLLDKQIQNQDRFYQVEYDNLVKQGKKLDAEEYALSLQPLFSFMSLQNQRLAIKVQQDQNAIGWFNAMTSRGLALKQGEAIDQGNKESAARVKLINNQSWKTENEAKLAGVEATKAMIQLGTVFRFLPNYYARQFAAQIKAYEYQIKHYNWEKGMEGFKQIVGGVNELINIGNGLVGLAQGIQDYKLKPLELLFGGGGGSATNPFTPYPARTGGMQ